MKGTEKKISNIFLLVYSSRKKNTPSGFSQNFYLLYLLLWFTTCWECLSILCLNWEDFTRTEEIWGWVEMNLKELWFFFALFLLFRLLGKRLSSNLIQFIPIFTWPSIYPFSMLHKAQNFFCYLLTEFMHEQWTQQTRYEVNFLFIWKSRR